MGTVIKLKGHNQKKRKPAAGAAAAAGDLAPESGERAMLEPGQMVIATGEGLSAVTSTDPVQSLAWREGRIVFYDKAFGAALSELQRYYDGQVLLVPGRVANRLISGNYRVDDPEAAIRTLAASAGASVTRLPGGVLILR